MLAVAGWCDGAGITRLRAATRVLRDEVALFVEGHVRGDENRNGESSAELELLLVSCSTKLLGLIEKATYLGNVSVGVLESDGELNLVADLDTVVVQILNTLAQLAREVQLL